MLVVEILDIGSYNVNLASCPVLLRAPAVVLVACRPKYPQYVDPNISSVWTQMSPGVDPNFPSVWTQMSPVCGPKCPEAQ